MTDRFQKRYPLHDRRSVHRVGSTASNPRFSRHLDQVSPSGTLTGYSIDRLARDAYDLGSCSLQANGMRITIVPQSVDSSEHDAE
jgi:DNA invertase Pin-like site-specific DNA recombinase